jgi:predicted lipid-binding transport protein (Tim44 family)
MLIPVPILGAVVGGTLGGVMVGLYQKIVVNGTKGSIFKMLNKLENYI